MGSFGRFLSGRLFAQPDMSAVEVIDLKCLLKTLLVLIEQRMLLVLCSPLDEKVFLTPVNHLAFGFFGKLYFFFYFCK